MLLTSLVLYSLSLWFAFYLLNHAEITSFWSRALKEKLGKAWKQPLECPLCLTFWASLILIPVYGLPVYLLTTAPVLVLFVELTYERLAHPMITITSGDQSYTGPLKTETRP